MMRKREEEKRQGLGVVNISNNSFVVETDVVDGIVSLSSRHRVEMIGPSDVVQAI